MRAVCTVQGSGSNNRFKSAVALGYMKSSVVSLLSLMSYSRGKLRSDWIVDVIKHKIELTNKNTSPPPPAANG